MLKTVILSVLALGGAASALGQEVVWEQVFDLDSACGIGHIELLPDGGYVALGTVRGGSFDTWLLRLDQNGDSLWTRRYDAPDSTFEGTWVTPSRDGGILFSSIVGSNLYHNLRRGNLFKVDANGEALWRRWQAYLPFYVRQLPDGTICTGGCNFGLGGGDLISYAEVVGEDGLHPPGDPFYLGVPFYYTFAYGLTVVDESRVAISGRTNPGGWWWIGLLDLYPQPHYVIGPPDNGVAKIPGMPYCIQPDYDGGYLLAGGGGSTEPGVLLKTKDQTDSYDSAWAVTFDLGLRFRSMAVLPDRGYLLCGYLYTGSITSSAVIIRTDSLGSTQMRLDLAHTGWNELYSIRPLGPGRYIAAGVRDAATWASSSSTRLGDGWVVYIEEPCCSGRVGDANGEGVYPDEITLGDIMLLVDVKFISGDCAKLPCFAEADVNQDGGTDPNCSDHVTLGDIMTLVDFLFITGPVNATMHDCL